MSMTRSLLNRWVAGVAFLFGPTLVYAANADYPVKPIRLIVPFPPGGSADPLARHFGTWLSDHLGQSVVCDNRPGAGTAIAHTLAARSTPDGYTLILGASSGLSTNPAIGTKLEYDPIKDFEPVSLAAYVLQLLVVHPTVPATTMREFIELSKTRPGAVNFGSPGVGSLGHLSIALLNNLSGSKFQHVPYKGAGPALLDVVGGRIHAYIGSVTAAQPGVQSGKLRAVATGHDTRLRFMPDVPTISETIPGFKGNGWYGVFGPAGMPAPIVKKLHDEMHRALADKEFAGFIEKVGMVPAGTSPQELREWVRSELARWTKAVKDAGIPPQGSK
jgi:tripartite-type tricarboxylate transporter receptor subunit TctC